MVNKPVRTIFFGSGNFAVKILAGIMEMLFLEVNAVVTQPDKPAGRAKKLTPCPVMEAIKTNGYKFTVYQPEKLKQEADRILKETDPEFVLVADYGQIIPAVIINYPKYKCLNVHGSLLPDLRGAVPAPVALLKGYAKTGVTIPVMTPGLDDGDIVAQQEVFIMPDDDTHTLRMHLAEVGNNLLKQILPLWFAGSIKLVPQDHSKATFTRQSDIAKEKAQITRETPMLHAERMVRAFFPWPVAWVAAGINGTKKRVKILAAEIGTETGLEPGGFRKSHKQLYLVLNDGVLLIKQVQLEGKPVMPGKEALFLNNAEI